ncbi:outer membrane protein OmpK [Acinetobacter bouvetii]|uniref:Nucleoside-specific channel-forming protein, Tsx n=1 Tax=Acinetobacter bouvetii TaxID=202951 RepID=A0A811GEJ9_9GAMM|nr:outer membrane protein OmpK [Acinetobacter bouvetii]CAB1221675.1 Nucleoside-specific channel-forming protein, Tsx [Acinetobacter bouvetii]
MKLTQLFTATVLASAAIGAHAQPIWQDFSISGLYGKDYELIAREDDQSTATFEYTAKLKYGDFFGFIDRTENDVSGKESYFEASPRLSLGAVSGTKLELGPIKDVLVATTWEGGEGFNNYLYGIGFDLSIPYFQYAQVNLYRANNDNIDDDYQFTFVYGIPFKLGSEDFLVDGFLDWSTSEDDHESERNWTTQWKWNAGKHISPDTRLYLGIEHSVWTNKYGIKNADENNVSALVKYHF